MKITFQVEATDLKEAALIASMLQQLATPTVKASKAADKPKQDTVQLQEPVQIKEDTPSTQEAVRPSVEKPVEVVAAAPVEVVAAAPVEVVAAAPVEVVAAAPVEEEEIDIREQCKSIARNLITTGKHIELGQIMTSQGVSAISKATDEQLVGILKALKEV